MTQRAPRFPANYPVVLRSGPDMFASTICNISTGGACLLGVDWLEHGQTFVLDYELGQTRATVTWSMGKMTGVRFDDPLNDSKVQSIRAGATAIPYEHRAAG